jgi:hypothetical protein
MCFVCKAFYQSVEDVKVHLQNIPVMLSMIRKNHPWKVEILGNLTIKIKEDLPLSSEEELPMVSDTISSSTSSASSSDNENEKDNNDEYYVATPSPPLQANPSPLSPPPLKANPSQPSPPRITSNMRTCPGAPMKLKRKYPSQGRQLDFSDTTDPTCTLAAIAPTCPPAAIAPRTVETATSIKRRRASTRLRGRLDRMAYIEALVKESSIVPDKVKITTLKYFICPFTITYSVKIFKNV